jgi:hypothetical protein
MAANPSARTPVFPGAFRLDAVHEIWDCDLKPFTRLVYAALNRDTDHVEHAADTSTTSVGYGRKHKTWPRSSFVTTLLSRASL